MFLKIGIFLAFTLYKLCISVDIEDAIDINEIISQGKGYTREGSSEASENHIFKLTYKSNTANYIQIKSYLTDPNESAYLYLSSRDDVSKESFNFHSQKQKVNKIFFPVVLNKNEENDENTNYFYYLLVVCPGNVTFTLEFLELDAIVISKQEMYSFVAKEPYLTINAKIEREESSTDLFNIYAVGNAKEEVELKVSYQDQKISVSNDSLFNGDIALIDDKKYPYQQGSNNFYSITVKAAPGAFITFGSSTLKEKTVIAEEEPIYEYFTNDLSQQCFKFDDIAIKESVISINIVSKPGVIAVFKYKDEEETTWEINGQIEKVDNILENSKICISKKKELSFAAYSIQVSFFNSEEITSSFLVKGLPNQVLLRGHRTKLYRPYRHSEQSNRTYFEIKVSGMIFGFQPFIIRCYTFPNCDPHESEEKDLIALKEFGGTYGAWIDNKNDFFSTEQTILAVLNDDESYGEYTITSREEQDKIIIYPNKIISYIINERGQENFTFTIDNDCDDFEIHIQRFNGDAQLSIEKNGKQLFNMKRLFAANKNIYRFSKSQYEDLKGTYVATVTGNFGEFYTIGVFLNYNKKDLDIQTVIDLEGKISNLYTLRPEEEKLISFGSIYPNYERGLKLFVSFYPLNCHPVIKFIRPTIPKEEVNVSYKREGYAQELIVMDSDHYDLDMRGIFSFKITNKDNSNEDDLCNIYITATYFGEAIGEEAHKILLTEGIPFQVELNKTFTYVHYVYPYRKGSGDVQIMVNLERVDTIETEVYLGKKKHEDTIIFSISRQVRITESDINSKCEFFENICSVEFKITLPKDKEFAAVETIIKAQTKIPIYLKKEKLLHDVLFAKDSLQYYVYEINHKEEGEIGVNFLRGSGILFANMIDKNSIQEGADWNGRVILPVISQNTNFDKFNNEFYYSKEYTEEHCKNGCDLYIGITSDSKFDKEIPLEYTLFSKIKNSNQESHTDIPINEYVIDTLQKEGSFHYYKVNIPTDSDEIYFEFQCILCKAYIKEGEETPTKAFYDYSFNGAKDRGFVKHSKNGQNLRNTTYTIAIVADVLDNIETSLFNFRVLTFNSSLPHLFPIQSEVQSICEVTEPNGYCYFIFPINHYHDISKVTFHATDFGLENEIRMYGKIVKVSEFHAAKDISSLLPTKENSVLKSFKDLPDFLQFPVESNEDSYALLGIRSTNPTIIKVINDIDLISQRRPNPFSPILMFSSNENAKNLAIEDDRIYSINIVSLYGNGKVMVAGKTKELPSYRSKFSINIPKGEKFVNISSVNGTSSFYWYLEYIIGSKASIFNAERKLENGVWITDRNFPVGFYSKVKSDDESISMNIIVEGDDTNFIIEGVVLSAQQVNDKITTSAKINEEEKITGVYDKLSHMGIITFKKSNIKKLSTDQTKYVYVAIRPEEGAVEPEVMLKAYVTSTEEKVVVLPMNKYYTSSLLEDQDKPLVFKLPKERILIGTEKKINFTIEFASNSPDVHYAIINSLSNDLYLNDTSNETEFVSAVYAAGKGKVSLYLKGENPQGVYLSVFYKNKGEKVPTGVPTDFIIKYTNDNKKSPVYSLPSKSVTNVVDGSSIEISFEAVSETKENSNEAVVVPAVYYIRGVKESKVKGDLDTILGVFGGDIIKTIEGGEEKNLTIKIEDISKYRGGVLTILAIPKDSQEYIAYPHIKIEGSSKSLNKLGTIMICVVTALVLIGFGLIIYFIIKNKKKYLKLNVDHTSFIGGPLSDTDQQGNVLVP